MFFSSNREIEYKFFANNFTLILTYNILMDSFGNISLAGDSSLTGIAAGGKVIENYGNIDLGSNNLDITADIYTNQASSNVTADTLNLDVSSLYSAW